GVDHRTILSTFGLVDPRKGLEYMIAAMPEIVARHPSALYLIVGQTHPELLKKAGEQYRNELVSKIESSGMSDNVRFVNQYLTQREIVDYLLATDVYVTPYLDLNQITRVSLARCSRYSTIRHSRPSSSGARTTTARKWRGQTSAGASLRSLARSWRRSR